MLPEAKGDDLLYVSNEYNVEVLSYPEGKVVGHLSGLSGPLGECLDKAQDIWIVDGYAAGLTEYAHGGSTPLATLSDPGSSPYGCAVDPTTGNLAVTNYGNETIDIYADAQGTPTSYNVGTRVFYCAYDGNGDLFVTNQSSSLLELPKGGNTFQNFLIYGDEDYLTSLQWTGGYLVASAEDDDRSTQEIYRIKLAGTYGTLVQTTTLDSIAPQQYVQFWVQGNTIIGPAHKLRNHLEFWPYPKGGPPKKHPRGEVAWGEAVSLAKK